VKARHTQLADITSQGVAQYSDDVSIASILMDPLDSIQVHTEISHLRRVVLNDSHSPRGSLSSCHSATVLKLDFTQNATVQGVVSAQRLQAAHIFAQLIHSEH
jgi:hypothetical protein